MKYIVPDESGGQRLDVYLSSAMPDVSRSRIQKIIAGGCVSVNGKNIVSKNKAVDTGDTVLVDTDNIPATPSERLPAAQDIPLDILYEDGCFAVINKPAGLVVHPGNGNWDGTVVNAILHRYGGAVSSGGDASRPGIVHRLDKDTSGALIVARTDAAHAALSELFQNRAVKKVYTGFCVGSRPADHEIIDLPLAGSRADPIKRAVARRGGKPAVTEYDLKAHKCGISLLEFVLHTGRTHQIRVHCGHKGFPIVQDPLYGGTRSAVQKIPPMERPFAYGVFKRFDRQALHARSLSFVHPFTKENFEVTAPYPEDFLSAFDFFTL